jgi:hypothetical protein
MTGKMRPFLYLLGLFSGDVMRLVGFVAASALLSGCSYFGGGGFGLGGQKTAHQQGVHSGAYAGGFDPCQIPHARAPLPQGCHPSQVSISTAGGFPQQPQFGVPQVATQNYGSHAGGNIHTQGLRGSHGPKARKPRFRGALDLGVEKSFQGSLLDANNAGVPSPFTGYSAANFNEGSVAGSVAGGEVQRTEWSTSSRPRTTDGAFDERRQPPISFDDAWSVPASIGLSGEYIVNDRATVFGRVGYAASEGASGTVAIQEATVYQDNIIETYDAGVLTGVSSGGTFFRPNTEVARVSYDFSDMKRLDLEAGGRVYFDPIAGQKTGQTVTPFVGAAAGASRFNSVSYKQDIEQLYYSSAIDITGTQASDEDLRYYDLDNVGPQGATNLYDSQWVPTGRLAAGLEWQVTPKTALAFETGVRVEGARDYSNGAKGDTNVTVPFTLRGSFNF